MTTKIGNKVKQALKRNDFVPAGVRIKVSPAKMVQILREKSGLTQVELAKRAKLTQATISSIENGRVQLGIERAKALALALHVHPASLLFAGWDSEAKRAA